MKAHSPAAFVFVAVVWAAACAALPGCATFDFSARKFPQADRNNPVARILCLWEPAEGSNHNGLPSRGFAGQIMFFTQGEAEPVRVDGNIGVYLFDDQGAMDEQSKPLHVYQFEPKAWDTYLTETTMGAAYSVFIPYTRTGHRMAECALRVKFQPADGPLIYSRMVNVVLPGTNDQAEGQLPLNVVEMTRRRGAAASIDADESLLLQQRFSPQSSTSKESATDSTTPPKKLSPQMQSFSIPLPSQQGKKSPQTTRE